MNAPFDVLGSRVLLRAREDVVEQDGLIIIPDSALDRQRYRQWEVVTIGEEVRDVKPDDWVLASGRFVGEEIDLDGQTYRVILEDNLIATISQEEEV